MYMKNIPFKYEPVHLLNGDQHSDGYITGFNPMHQVPSMKVELDNGETHILTQSLAMIKFLDTMYPEKSIYPKDPILAAKAQAIADTVSGGIQPLQNLETLVRYKEALGSSEEMKPEERKTVAQYWINRKLLNLEELVKKTAGKYCVGDEVTIADCALVPQMFNARRFELDTSKYPTLKAIDERLHELDMFKLTTPFHCPDAVKKN